VSQISPPIRIVLVLAVAVLGMYMLFLRPKTEVVPPAEPAPNVQTNEPAVSEPGKVAESAQDAVNAANGQLEKQESVDGVDAGEAAAGTAATGTKTEKPSAQAKAEAAAIKEELKGLPKPVATALRKDKVLVLLFWNGKSADDKAVAKALHNVDRWDGRVSVQRASIKKIAAYGRIARGVDVEQSPTIVIADRDLKAETLIGYVDSRTIDQAVMDAFRNSGNGKVLTSAYLRKADAVCVEHGNALAALPNYYEIGHGKQRDRIASSYQRANARFLADFKAIKAPKRWRAYDAASVADITAYNQVFAQFATAITPAMSGSAFNAASARFVSASKPIVKRADQRFDSKGLFRCGSQF
jgi:hypothetical protein